MDESVARLRTPGDIGLAIQQARLGRGLSQEQLAAATGLRQSVVSEIESGKSTIYLRQLLALAESAGVQFSASWTDPEEGPHEARG